MRKFTLRLSIRKLTLYSLAVTSCLLLALNIHQRTLGLFTTLPYTSNSLHRGGHRGVHDSDVIHTTVPPPPSANASSSSSLLEPDDNRLLVVPQPQQRPWYMQGGSVRPPPHVKEGPGTFVFPDQASQSCLF